MNQRILTRCLFPFFLGSGEAVNALFLPLLLVAPACSWDGERVRSLPFPFLCSTRRCRSFPLDPRLLEGLFALAATGAALLDAATL